MSSSNGTTRSPDFVLGGLTCRPSCVCTTCYAVRSDGAFLRNLFSGGARAGWVQIGVGWDQFTHVFMGADGWIYATRSDGRLFRNLSTGPGTWHGWEEL